MNPKVSNSVKCLILSVLESKAFHKLNKCRKDFIVSVLWHILSIKGRINFLQLERFSPVCEQTFRNQFAKEFDFLSFNKELINQVASDQRIIAIDPCYIPKAGKSTYGRGKYWSGVAGTAKWGLDICGFAVVDLVNNTALHLKAWQTPPAEELEKSSLNLLAHYARLVTENADGFKAFSNYMVADAWFSKRPFVQGVKSSGMEFIGRLRDDSVLKYKYTGPRTGKKGAPKKFAGVVDVFNFNPNHFSLDFSNQEMTIYSLVVYSRALKMDIKLAIAIFYNQGKEMARKLFFSTDLALAGEKIVQYYQARFQIEFLYRDAKQFTGLNNCQARSKNKLDFHFNAALTAVNLAKHDWYKTKGKEEKPFSMSDYKTMYNNTLMLERFMCRFAINPNTPKNQKIVKELLDYGKIAA